MSKAEQPPTSGSLLFYRQLEPFTQEDHGKLGVSQSATPWAHLAGTHVVPLLAEEFAHAAVCYPIVFSVDTKTPLAIMGPRPGVNVFLAEDGSMDPEAYVPAYARRYPFLPVAAEGTTDPLGGGQRQVLCIDRAAPTVSDKPEIPFFENGEQSDYTKDAIESCKRFEDQAKRTREFINIIDKYGLFERMDLTVPQANPDGTEGTPLKVDECLRISEQKMKALPPDVFRQFLDAGLPFIAYAHLLSLGLWQKILSRAVRLSPSS